jgi:glycyl-tRNA synthetase beta chain
MILRLQKELIVMADFLLEIGLEEVPARMIAGAEAELGRRVNDLLTRERLLASGAKLTTYSTPRRLAVLVEGVLASQADTEEQLTGPSWKVAFKDGAPTPAAEAFAKKAGVAAAALEKVTNAKGEYVGAKVKRQGRAASELLTTELPKEVISLYWAKNMYWRAGKPERFVRPVRWVVALLDSAVVPLEIAGIKASNISRGHRILHGEHSVLLPFAKSYKESLRAAKVIVDVAERRQSIRKALDAATRTVAGARWRADEPLIETVVHLTEWPTVVLGDFEPEYLALPEEVLVTVMRDHQKYFAVEGADGKLAPHFLAVLNTQVDAEGEAIIRHGNARVLRARFKDARFFWEFDQKTPLVEREEALMFVTFQKQLGSYHEKVKRIQEIWPNLVRRPENQFQHPPLIPGVDEDALRLAVSLCKSDLTCELVKEFTELQGAIGGLYAAAQGNSRNVADAIYDHYKPTSSDDEIPRTIEGCLLSISDKLDTIAGMFALGLVPTGSRDPFALRRAANGIIKILAEWPVQQKRGLEFLSQWAIFPYGNVISRVVEKGENKSTDWASLSQNVELDNIPVDQTRVAAEITAFLRERLSFYLKDVRGFAYDVVSAVLAAGDDDVRDAIARAEALTAARESADFAAISAAFKRIKNILRQAEEKGFALGSPKDVKLAPEAQQLAAAATALVPVVAKLRQQRAYGEALAAIATLRPVVDTFFDKVMVLDNDPAFRGANLGLIDEVLRGFSGIADFSEIVTG